MTLHSDYIAALNDASDTAANGYLQLLAPFVKEIENSSSADRTLKEYCRKLKDLVQRNDFMLKGKLVEKFAQLFGEAHFYYLCHERGITLTKIPEQKNKKTPDFVHSSAQHEVHFEVKTLSVVDGGRGINKYLENALDAQISINKALLNFEWVNVRHAD